MQYLGGKSRTYKEICAFLESIRKPNQPFVEPFCGACWVTQGMSNPRYASDANEALITMYKALQNGWTPPSDVSEEYYTNLKTKQDVKDPLTAFVGFGCSFGGKWFGGYARGTEGRNYAANAHNSLMKKKDSLHDVKFKHQSYKDINVNNCLIYCDPPYANTTGYGAVGEFNSAEFWSTMRDWCETNTVVVSEYTAPEDFVCVWSKETKTDMHTKSGKEPRVERLFMHESQVGKA